MAKPAPSFGASRLFIKFLMLFVPVFAVFCGAGLLILADYNTRAAHNQLSARIGTNVARIALSLERSLEQGYEEAGQSLISTLLADRAIECAEYRKNKADPPVLKAPRGIGCVGQDDLEILNISTGADDKGELSVRFSLEEVAELARSEREFSFAILLGGLLIALIASAVGFRMFLGRPLERLLNAIRSASENGTHNTVAVKGRDEISKVIDAYNVLQSRAAKFSSELEKKIYYDELTGLLNRAGFNKKLNSLLNSNPPSRFALIIVDINDFKLLNDHHGHWTGDEALRTAARKLQNVIGPGHFVCRIGGDEFAILAIQKSLDDGTRRTAFDRLTGCHLEIESANEKIKVKFSFGAAFYPEHGNDAGTLMKHADLAMYAAKKNAYRHVQLFHHAMAVEFDRRARIRKQFNEALTKNELCPHYQPLINLSTGKVVGLEALVRWKHPQSGLLSPYDFQDVFEDRDSKALLARRVIKCVIRDINSWKREGVPFGSVALNVEITDLEDDRFVEFLVQKLKENHIPPREITIEITENTALNRENKVVMNQLYAIRSAGIDIALDDFGTGYSSLSHVRDLPLTALKLDKSFVGNILNSEKEHAIAQFLVELSKRLNLKCVAEGIERREELSLLQRMNCDLGQGFLFARPVPPHEVADIIDRLTATGGPSPDLARLSA